MSVSILQVNMVTYCQYVSRAVNRKRGISFETTLVASSTAQTVADDDPCRTGTGWLTFDLLAFNMGLKKHLASSWWVCVLLSSELFHLFQVVRFGVFIDTIIVIFITNL